MQTWMVWTVTPITTISLRQFVQGLGGSWLTDVADDEAIIEQDDARVYVSSADVNDEENVVPDDVDYATTQMSTRPASMLSISIGHGSGSLELAEDVASKAVRNWGGFLDRNEPC